MCPKLLLADYKNNIFDVDGIAAIGMKAGIFYPLTEEELIPLPFGSELFMLRDRIAAGFLNHNGQLQEVRYNPFSKRRQRCFPVAAFISPGYTATFNAAYIEEPSAKLLPMFSYAAVCWHRGRFYTTAVRVDRERRQDMRLMDMKLMRKNAARFTRLYPKNRLVKHLSVCACAYGCPAAINFFLGRYECPLPASPFCNSLCIGCISARHSAACPAVQPRIKFIPTAQEIAEVALQHIETAKQPVVSFGQGCEGEPLLVADILEEAVKLIRKDTKKGIINLNTNASRPRSIERLRLAGLDSIRVSINSARERFYNLYYKPRNYAFKDVIASIKIMKRLGGFVSINYFVMPGFTDHKEEVKALLGFIARTGIDMVQWRNLNYDPVDYFRRLGITNISKEKLIGVKQLIEKIRDVFPRVRHGYFNPFLTLYGQL